MDIPTAEEFLENYRGTVLQQAKDNVRMKTPQEALIEFTTFHVQAALKAVSELEETNGTHGYKIYPESILNAYPLTNIK